ncbi:hypothetical protein Ancab_021353 [Ancistrocladus abbreviatus]
MEDTAVRSRRRPLHACGVSFLTILRSIHTKALEIGGPMGSVTRRIDRVCAFANPLIYVMQYQWLVVLAFADDHIIAIEKMIEACFPSSSYVFNKVDNMVFIVETLPAKFDDAMSKLPSLVHQVPHLDWALLYANKWFEFLVSALPVWGWNSAKEKDIMVDSRCKDKTKGISISGTSTPENIPEEDEAKKVDLTKGHTYKEALNKGVKKNAKRQYQMAEKTQKGKDGVEKGGKGEGKSANNIYDNIVKDEDPILELFELGWQTPKNGQIGALISRSASHA